MDAGQAPLSIAFPVVLAVFQAEIDARAKAGQRPGT